MKTFDWPIEAVVVTDDQAVEEQNSKKEVDLPKALKACAAGLIDANDEKLLAVGDAPADITPVGDARQFKNGVLFSA